MAKEVTEPKVRQLAATLTAGRSASACRRTGRGDRRGIRAALAETARRRRTDRPNRIFVA